MRPDPRLGDDIVDRIEMHHFVATLDPDATGTTPDGAAANHTSVVGDTEPAKEAIGTTGTTGTTEAATPPTSATAVGELRTQRRARRLTTMAATQAVALVGAFAAMAMPWYKVSVAATQVMTEGGQLIAIAGAQVAASGFDLVHNGATSPYCPATPLMWGLPVPLAFAALTVALAGVAVLLRSIVAAGASVVTALQAVRHLGVLHASVTGGPDGCLIGQLETAAGRPLFIVMLTVLVTLSMLVMLQLWMLRSAEKQAKIAAGEPVPPSLVEMIQGRLVGVAAAVVAEAQRR
jgi:hypothetical protein